MNRFEGFEDPALDQRLKRLTRSARELRERILDRAAAAERAGRYIVADPAYRRLSSLLRTVQQELHETTQEQLRRRTIAR